ncbi:phage tail protein [Mucilaginibacter jinjuensis]|uniref:Tail fiber protein n=1 Tax=Mucilaginibacter jinjuensis TaxID=1176721 RepID=A0ABY7TC26_9SPHI|nr:tail fiber protein [Mucilaginibacter jinjuensis]WCT14069.1 tail fiber protein [Mucilaginibacter jinjuensis]
MDYYLGEIRTFGFGVIPKNWLSCSGQILSISQNQALFSLLGTTYGGNGVTTFALPNLQGTAPLGYGNGRGTSTVLGETAGTENVTLINSQLPMHNHILEAVNALGTSNIGAGVNYPAQIGIQTISTPHTAFASNGYINQIGPGTILHPNSIAPTGGNAPHENRMPFLTLNICISLSGVFPSRN